ncbi:MAG: hypothetical protein M3N49_15015, partial [Candidatus Eremiobacteraeota bacterium]|nr:hypothetical protein [Candidatus Eremiobacteraeota bacterium]
ACLAGVALSPHALAYDAALALPMIAFTASQLAEPARTRMLLAVFLVAPLFFLSSLLHFDPLALVVIGGTGAWIYAVNVPFGGDGSARYGSMHRNAP